MGANLRHVAVVTAFAGLMAGCATPPEMKMTPAPSGDVGVRYSRGESFMLSAGERGAILLAPVRYNGSSEKVLFVLAGYNHADLPINFGTENAELTLDNGVELPVHNFDGMRHGYKLDADRQRLVAAVEASINVFLASQEVEPDLYKAGMLDAARLYEDRTRSIAQNLMRRARTAAATVLQTTTIDPGAYWAGWIIADQPSLSAGEVRRITARVEFAGETHTFNLYLSPEGTSTPPHVGLPAVTQADGERSLHKTRRTWLWDVDQPTNNPARRCYETRTVRYCGYDQIDRVR